ncbi:MAG: RNA polymerase sigma factor [Deltaproteobacteria bacterium]|nr:RNA polymerase sigma factor [Deltaproteobacteria bacterium]
MNQLDDRRLIREAKEGSGEALNKLFDRYGARLLSLIRLRMGRSLRQQLESQDLLQQTMLKAFQRIDQFAGGGETSLMGWLGAIARNEVHDQVKYFRRGGRDVARAVPLEAVGEAMAQQLRTEVSRLHLLAQAQALENAIESLQERHREILLLRRFEELTFPQIGKQLGKSPDACRMLYSRAMAALTFELQDKRGD